MARTLAYVPENIGGHDILLAEIPRLHSRVFVRCAFCGRERWTRLHEFRRLGGYPCRNCSAANRGKDRVIADPALEWRLPWRTPPGILVSSDGQVSRHGYLLRQEPDRYGRLLVRPKVNGRQVRFYVHILVCEAFHGPKPFPSAQAAHENDVCTDNRAENLSWKSRAENIRDAQRNGKTRRGASLSPETRTRISASLTGRTQSAETIAKRSASLRESRMRRKAGEAR